MQITMYQASVPVFIRGLKQLAAILDKAAAHAQARNIDPDVLVRARLYPDMFPLNRQVHLATDHAKNASSRLSGAERPTFADDEATFDELQARIGKTIAYVESLSPESFDGSEDRAIVVPTRRAEISTTGLPYLLQFALPNFYFHLTTAYAILRHSGVEIGKPDFIGPLPD